MTITQEQLTQLTRIYNTLMTISTRGEDTIVMSDCVRAMQQVLVDINKCAQDNIAGEA